jgi:hypothetical protein
MVHSKFLKIDSFCYHIYLPNQLKFWSSRWSALWVRKNWGPFPFQIYCVLWCNLSKFSSLPRWCLYYVLNRLNWLKLPRWKLANWSSDCFTNWSFSGEWSIRVSKPSFFIKKPLEYSRYFSFVFFNSFNIFVQMFSNRTWLTFRFLILLIICLLSYLIRFSDDLS